MGYLKKNGETNKEIISKIYKKVYEKNKKPRPLDYARAIYDIKNPDDEGINNIAITQKVAKTRITVMKALKQLTEGDDPKLGVIDKYYYVPKEVADEYNSRVYLLENLHPTRWRVLRHSKKLCIIALNKDRYITPRVKMEKDAEFTEIELPNNKNVSPDTEFLLTYINELRGEVHQLRNEVNVLRNKEAEKEEVANKIKEIIESLRIFIGAEFCYSIFSEQDSIVIVLKAEDEEVREIERKLNKLIAEIMEKEKKKKIKLFSPKQ